MPDCDICGKNTGELYLVTLEGAKMHACADCSKSVTVLGKVREAPKKKETVIKQEAPEIEIVDNYAELIQKGRRKLGLDTEQFAKQINETVSIVKKIETGKMAPNEKTAWKIEKILGVKLYQQVKMQL